MPRARPEQQFQRKVARRALGPLPASLAARVSLVVFEMPIEIYRAQPPKPVRTPPALPSKETSRAIALAYPLHGSIDDTTWRSVWWERSLFLWPGGNWGARRKGKISAAGSQNVCGGISIHCVKAATFALSSALKSATMPVAVSFTCFSVVFFSISNFATGA